MALGLELFERCELRTPALEDLLRETVARVEPQEALEPGALGRLREGSVFAGMPAGVSREGEILLEAAPLLALPRPVALAIIAHEIAHRLLGHWRGCSDPLRAEADADAKAASWGFDVALFREICGPATLG
jgi:hypothetical protein